MIDTEFGTLTELGKKLGVSSHVIGRWIGALGLRIVGGDPTAKARELGLVKTAPTGRGEGTHLFYLWHLHKTMRLLEDAGHRPTQLPEQQPGEARPNPLIGPFSSRTSGTNGYEILNGDGKVFGWITGERAATWAVRLLNLADEHGKFA